MRNVIVTSEEYNFSTIHVARTIVGLELDGVECLIYHSSDDSDLTIVLELSKLKDRVNKIIYINKEINPMYYCVFMGLEADIYDMEEYLDSEDTLLYLIDNYGDTGMTIKSPSSDVETLAKCVATISTNNLEGIQKLLSNDFWVKSLSMAVTGVDTAVTRASTLNISLVEMLNETRVLLDSLQASQEKTAGDLLSVRKMIAELETKDTRGTNLFIFNTCTVPANVRSVMQVKALGHYKYFNSFILAYQHYLGMHRHSRCKLLFVLPKLPIMLQRFGRISRLAMDSIDIINIEKSDTYVTFEPRKAILDKFFSQSKVDLFIVVDLMFGEPIVSGPMVKNYYIVSGISDFDLFKGYRGVNLSSSSKVFFTNKAPAEGLLIPHIQKYGSNITDTVKKTMYYDSCKDIFAKIDKDVLKTL